MARNRSASEYNRRKKVAVLGRHVIESTPVRYKQSQTRSHRRLEEGTARWVQYSF